jgi:hypothetical protein
LTHGLIKRIYRLTSNTADCEQNLKDIWLRLRHRGHSSATLQPIFDSGYANQLMISDKITTSSSKIIFLHVSYHPANPPSRVLLQHHFRDLLQQPRGEIPLPCLRNCNNYPCGIK